MRSTTLKVLIGLFLLSLAGCGGGGETGPKDDDDSGWHTANQDIFAKSSVCQPYMFGSEEDPRLCFVSQTISGGEDDVRLLYGDEYDELFETIDEAACSDMTEARLIPLGAIRQDFSCFVFKDGEVQNGDPIIFSAYFTPPGGNSPFLVNADGTSDVSIQEAISETKSTASPSESLNPPGPGPNLNQRGVMDDEFTPPDTPVPAGTANCEPGLSKVESDGQEMCISV